MQTSKVYGVFLSFLLLAGCGSSPVELSSEGEQYFSDNDAKYSSIQFTVTAEDESKATKAGYMSNAAAKKYMEAELKKQLATQSRIAANGLSIAANLKVTRVYSWGGSDSMARLDYSTWVEIKRDKQVLGTVSLGGGIADNSIIGNFKSIFAKNTSKDEGKYFDVIVRKIVENLPK